MTADTRAAGEAHRDGTTAGAAWSAAPAVADRAGVAAVRVRAPAGVLVVVGLVALAAACGGSGGQASPSPAASGPVVLTVKGEQGSRTFTMSQLQALPSYEGYAGIKSSTGTITPPSKYKGVPLAALADLVGGITEANGVTIVAKDGYGMTFSYRQIMDDGFTTYDPATGEEEPPDGKLTLIIAYEHDGKPIDRRRRPAQAGRRRGHAGPGRRRPLGDQVARRRSR